MNFQAFLILVFTGAPPVCFLFLFFFFLLGNDFVFSFDVLMASEKKDPLTSTVTFKPLDLKTMLKIENVMNINILPGNLFSVKEKSHSVIIHVASTTGVRSSLFRLLNCLGASRQRSRRGIISWSVFFFLPFFPLLSYSHVKSNNQGV